MFYPKNVPNIERVLRIALGVAVVAFVVMGQSMIGSFSPLLTGVAIFSALFMIVTGFVGWCPACALVGRKLKSQRQHDKQS